MRHGSEKAPWNSVANKDSGKLDGLQKWKFRGIVDTLPILLQLSLYLLGVALSANIWIQQHTVRERLEQHLYYSVSDCFSAAIPDLRD